MSRRTHVQPMRRYWQNLNSSFHTVLLLNHKYKASRLVDFLNKYSYTKVHLDMTSNQVLSDVRGEHILLQQLIIIRLNEQKYIPVPIMYFGSKKFL